MSSLRAVAARVQRRRRCASTAPIDPAAAVVAPRNLPPGVHRQPDGTTCGPAALVMARHLSAATVHPHELDDPAGFAERVRRTHRATNRGRDEHGRRQLPWPRALGTQPWALARQLGGGRAYRVRIDHPRERGRDFDEVVAAVRAGYPAALYIGDHVAPRHVVLAFAAIARSAYVDAHLSVAGWDEPWLAVLPA